MVYHWIGLVKWTLPCITDAFKRHTTRGYLWRSLPTVNLVENDDCGERPNPGCETSPIRTSRNPCRLHLMVTKWFSQFSASVALHHVKCQIFVWHFSLHWQILVPHQRLPALFPSCPCNARTPPTAWRYCGHLSERNRKHGWRDDVN